MNNQWVYLAWCGWLSPMSQQPVRKNIPLVIMKYGANAVAASVNVGGAMLTNRTLVDDEKQTLYFHY